MIKRFLKDSKASQALEFALITPILLLLIIGVVEIGRYILIQQKISKSAYQIADQVSRLNPATSADLDAIVQMGNEIISPFEINGTAAAPAGIRITAVNNATAANADGVTQWSQEYGVLPSRFGPISAAGGGDNPDYDAFDTAFTLLPDESIYIIEVQYNYSTIFLPLTFIGLTTPQGSIDPDGDGQTDVYHYTIIKPRTGAQIPAL